MDLALGRMHQNLSREAEIEEVLLLQIDQWLERIELIITLQNIVRQVNERMLNIDPFVSLANYVFFPPEMLQRRQSKVFSCCLML